MPKRPKNFDPIAVLRAIAEDADTPATARVAACKALLVAEREAGGKPTANDPKAAPGDRVTKAALKLLKGGKQ